MDKLFEAILDTLKDLAKGRFQFLRTWLDAAFLQRDLFVTWVSHQLRRTGDKSILIVAILASVVAVFGYISTFEKVLATKPSHDAILKVRFSSPLADPRIVIVDVDERSIAALADSHGRWPWSRDVLADGIQKLEQAGVKGVLFNVLLAEPDRNNLDADAAMDITAQLFRPIAFPLVRLAKDNDELSQLKASEIPRSEAFEGGENKTISAIIPLFESMHDRLGVSNHRLDEDGIVRRHAFWWSEELFRLPSLVQTTLSASQVEVAELPEVYSLNWRNKRTDYQRISFSDLYQERLSEDTKLALNESLVILGVSAPGIGQTKPTAIKPVVDDSEILATALDDALNSTYLRVIPPWVLLILNFASIWLLYLGFSNRVARSPPINRIFVVLQFFLGGVTLLSVSYTNYLVDLTDSMKFSLAVFGAIKLLQLFDTRWIKGKKGYRRFRYKEGDGVALVCSFLDASGVNPVISSAYRKLEATVGNQRVVYVDDLLGGENFLRQAVSSGRSFVIFIKTQAERDRVELILSECQSIEFAIREIKIPGSWDLESKELAQCLVPEMLSALSQLYSLR